MSILNYPSIGEYKLPEKNVLVISCIDLRLMDNLLDFLHHDNLTNRYDHYIMAGASLCAFAETKHKEHFKEEALTGFKFKSWKTALDEHLKVAIDLHDIRDVYIVEHASCGAYKEFLKDGKFDSYEKEREIHTLFSSALADEIHSQPHEEYKKGKKVQNYTLNVHTFLMDLQGNVEHLNSWTNKFN